MEGSAAWSATDWKHPAFDDGAWKEGPAQLGYGEGDEATVIPSGPVNDKWVSSYFRHPFTLKDTTGVTVLLLRLKRDDGAIVYLNGHEAARMSIRAGTVTATTPGDNASDDGQSFNELPIDPALLRTGHRRRQEMAPGRAGRGRPGRGARGPREGPRLRRRRAGRCRPSRRTR